MKRFPNSMLMSMFATVTFAMAGAALSQPAPPAPPAAAAASAPAPMPALAPLPPLPPDSLDFDSFDVEQITERARDMAERAAGLRDFHYDLQFDLQDRMQGVRDRIADLKLNLPMQAMGPMLLAQSAATAPRAARPPQAPTPAPAPFAFSGLSDDIRRGRTIRSRDSEERMYRRGAEYLDKHEWEKAVEAYDEVIDFKGVKADGAYYWKAYALAKLGRRDQALAAISELQKSYASSRWLNDAKALDAEVRRANGQPLSPETENDEDLKVLAINSLIGTDPERAIPLLDKMLQGRNTQKLKERALFVLAQSRTPKAQEIVVRYAKGSGNPDLQMKAVEYLGIYGGKDNLQTLSDVYGSAGDPGLKRMILRSFMVAKDKDRLLSAAKTEQNPELRAEAIRLLGNLGAQPELGQLYGNESSADVRSAILDAMYNAGYSDKLLELARSEKDAKLRTAAIHRLGNMRKSKTADALVSLYSSETDKGVKQQILRSLYNQGSAKELVDVARKESDAELRREAVHMLSNMKSKEATDYLVELLNK